uniref:Uncharacterized protein n=1 Tax=Mus musculus TaxID=10090 RepID=Q3TB76_MOUSE|nr:unnamed protein product [Mus musculus]
MKFPFCWRMTVSAYEGIHDHEEFNSFSLSTNRQSFLVCNSLLSCNLILILTLLWVIVPGPTLGRLWLSRLPYFRCQLQTPRSFYMCFSLLDCKLIFP